MRFSFPVCDTVFAASAPEQMPSEIRGNLIRTALNAVYAQIARKREIRSPAGYARGTFERGVRAWEDGTWELWRDEHLGEEARLEELRMQPADLRLDELMQVLLAGHPAADGRVGGWVRILLGHDLGGHDTSCTICSLAEGREWWLLLRACGTDPRTVRNFRSTLIDGGHLSRADFELAEHELEAQRREANDDF